MRITQQRMLGLRASWSAPAASATAAAAAPGSGRPSAVGRAAQNAGQAVEAGRSAAA